MADEMEDKLGTYASWASGFTRKSLDAALRDQLVIQRGQLNDGNDFTRYTPSGLSKSHYDKVRAERDDLDYREWNDETGYSGVTRWPQGPGMVGNGVQTEAQKRRRARREQIDDGF